jgi:hypothetical protein
MAKAPEGFDGTTKWDATKSALNTALNASRLTLNVGLDLFPTADVQAACTGEACCAAPDLAEPLTVPIGPGSDTVPTILSVLDTTSPGGGTPTAAGLARALDYYTNGDGFNIPGDKYVLLVTDGAPNCNAAAVCDATKCLLDLIPDSEPSPPVTNPCAGRGMDCIDDQSVMTEIQALSAAGVSTIVVGLPGSEPFAEYFNAFALAGGKPNPDPTATTAYYAVAESDGVTALTDTLFSITIDLVKDCIITYTKPPDDPGLVNVLVDCIAIPRDPTDGGDGSYWTLDMSTATITLGGPICDRILNQGVNRVDYIFGCPTI